MIKKTMIEQQSALDEVDEFIEQYVGTIRRRSFIT